MLNIQYAAIAKVFSCRFLFKSLILHKANITNVTGPLGSKQSEVVT